MVWLGFLFFRYRLIRSEKSVQEAVHLYGAGAESVSRIM